MLSRLSAFRISVYLKLLSTIICVMASLQSTKGPDAQKAPCSCALWILNFRAGFLRLLGIKSNAHDSVHIKE
jgi:hypothetical protein